MYPIKSLINESDPMEFICYDTKKDVEMPLIQRVFLNCHKANAIILLTMEFQGKNGFLNF
ncbi:hypothetical protein NCCP133_12210 [Cytobacillus sp. NCCP-133]|nr:hypothetical protein NCCP133_12210 [Cytobacillus sp. NCCP-133]